MSRHDSGSICNAKCCVPSAPRWMRLVPRLRKDQNTTQRYLMRSLLLLAFAAATTAAQTRDTHGWPLSTPEAQKLDPAPLAALIERAKSGAFGNVDRFVVVRNGMLVIDERFSQDYKSISRGQRSPLG